MQLTKRAEVDSWSV